MILPVPAPIPVTIDAARRFVRRALLLDSPAPDVAAALAHLGYIQVDPLNVCGRMHDLILRNRVAGYREGGLHAHIHAPERRGFEHYRLGGHGVLVAFPLEAWPFLTAGMRRRSRLRQAHSGRLTPREVALAEQILGEIAARGPLTSDDIEHEGRARSAWGRKGRLVQHVLEKLFAHGRVLIAARRNFRRVYDLAERVLPGAVFDLPPRAEAEVQVWLVLQRLRQRRLVSLNRRELSLVADHVQPVAVDGLPTLYCLRPDAPIFDAVMAEGRRRRRPCCWLRWIRSFMIAGSRAASGASTTRGRRTRRRSEGKRGHYALPVLAGTEIVGHVDPKADRARGRLQIVSRRVRRGHKTAAAVEQLAGFLGLRR